MLRQKTSGNLTFENLQQNSAFHCLGNSEMSCQSAGQFRISPKLALVSVIVCSKLSCELTDGSLNIYVYIHIYMYIYICICIHICECIYIYIYMYIYKYLRIYIYKYIYIYICVYTYMYIHIYIYVYMY